MLPNWTQISGAADRLVLMALMYAVAKGWIASENVTEYATLILGIMGAIYAFWVNRSTNLVARAATVKDENGKPTMIVTTPAIAEATPNLPNVVSSEDVKVVAK